MGFSTLGDSLPYHTSISRQFLVILVLVESLKFIMYFSALDLFVVPSGLVDHIVVPHRHEI